MGWQLRGAVLHIKTSSLHTVAPTREVELWEDTHDCQGNKCTKCRMRRRNRLPPGEVGGAKRKRHFYRTPLNWPQGE